MEEFSVKQIGTVVQAEDGFAIELEKKYKDALMETEGFSHLIIIWWAHLFDSQEYREITVSNKPYKRGPEKIGIFATRSQIRPNPIAITPVYVLKVDRENGIVYTPYIDAEPGTPVLDIKPYQPCSDNIRDNSVPSWCSHWPTCVEESGEFNWGEEFNFPE